MKSKMAVPGKFNQILFCPMLENYFHVFQRNVKGRLYFQQFNVNSFQEWRFPLRYKHNTVTRSQRYNVGHSACSGENYKFIIM